MEYQGLRLQYFRSYEDYSVELSPSVNIVVGPNASGKTNLLEAIYVISQGSSFRVSAMNLVRNTHDWARVDARLAGQSRVLKIKQSIDKADKSFDIDGKVVSRLSKKTIVPTVLFEPTHLDLIHGSPELRRSFMDTLLKQVEPTYASQLLSYKKLLAQRNRLLKIAAEQEIGDQLFVWDLGLSESAALLVAARKKLIAEINEQITDIYSNLSAKSSLVTVEYVTKVNLGDYRSSLLNHLTKRANQDILRGYTSVGPHREDLSLFLNGKEASVSASRGETRSIILALKIIELGLVGDGVGAKPTLLLDDVFSELDSARRRALTEYLKGHQTIITTTDADVALKYVNDSHVIPL